MTNQNYQNFYTNSHLIAVGINAYQDPRFVPLGNAEDDASRIAEVLGRDPYRFTVTRLLGREATKAAISGALTSLIEKTADEANANDRIIFYFAGHGYVIPDTNGHETGYLACIDTNPAKPFDGFELEDVIKIRRHSRAKHIVFIFDACFSGAVLGLTRSPLSPGAADKYLTRRAYQVLTAGGFEVVSDARSMTGALVQALTDGIPGSYGPFTFSQIGQHVRDTIANVSRNMQIPICQYLEGSSNGDCVFEFSHVIIDPPDDPGDPNLLPPPFEWCEIPAGTVILENDLKPIDVPAFAIAKYPVTNAQFQVFADADDGYSNPRWWTYSDEAREWWNSSTFHQHPHPSNFQGDNVPRTNVTWFEAIAFCNWLSVQIGQTITLPTEWQWQHASQGDSRFSYPWGNAPKPNKQLCNFGSNVGQPTDVTRYRNGASPYGVMDMSGNVLEWCLNTYSSPNETDLRGKIERGIRGGAWNTVDLRRLRTDARGSARPDIWNEILGFRLVALTISSA